jgi:Na+/H+ antiporter NhaD/arsenite permease-like protein
MSDIVLLILAESGAEHHDTPLWVTLLFSGFLVAMIVTLALEEKIHAKKSIIVGLFAIVCLFLGAVFHLLPFEKFTLDGQKIDIPVYIPGINWEVIAIILGSSLFVDVTSRSGLFTWVAIKLTKASGGDPLKLLWCYGVMTVGFSAVLNNVTAMIIVGSLTGVSLRKLGRGDKLLGFLLIEGLLTNVGGLLTLISSVPNIILGNAAGISFVRFFVTAAPYVLIATVATLFMGAKLFGIRRLGSEEERAEARDLVGGFDENDGIESRGFFWFGAVMTVLFIIVVATASQLEYVRDLRLGFVALSFAAIMLIRFKAVADTFYRAIDWDLIAFFAGLFVVINVMEHAQVLALIGEGLKKVTGLGDSIAIGSILVGASAFSSVTDNIPLAAMLANIFKSIGIAADSPLWWSVVFGANLGGNLTPIGSASTLVAVTIMHKQKVPVGFVGFVKKALPYAALHIALATAYVYLLAML